MSNRTVVPLIEALNITSTCGWYSQGNQTEPRVMEHLDAAEHRFNSIIPYGLAVPALICLFIFLALFSLVVNVLTMFNIESSDDLSWQPRFILCKNLIWSDFLQTFTFAPAVIYSLVQHQTMLFSLWCYLQYIVGTACIFSSLTTITCMALERYLFVCFALQYTVIVTQARLRKVLFLIRVFSVSMGVISTFLLLYTGKEERNDHITMGLLCEPDIMEQHMGSPRASAVFRKVMGSCTLLLCLLAHAFSYFRMYRDASNAVVPFNEVNNAARKTVMFYCGMLFLQLLPLLIKVVSDVLWEFHGTGIELSSQSPGGCNPTPSATTAVFHVSLLILLLVPPCINPLVYGLRNAEIRKALTKLLRWRTENRIADQLPREIFRLRNIVHHDLAEAG